MTKPLPSLPARSRSSNQAVGIAERGSAIARGRKRIMYCKAGISKSRLSWHEKRLEISRLRRQLNKLDVPLVPNLSNTGVQKEQDGLTSLANIWQRVKDARNAIGTKQDAYDEIEDEYALEQEESKFYEIYLPVSAGDDIDMNPSSSASPSSENFLSPGDLSSKYTNPLYKYETNIGEAMILRETLDALCFERHEIFQKARLESLGLCMDERDLEFLETFDETRAEIWKNLHAIEKQLLTLEKVAIDSGLMNPSATYGSFTSQAYAPNTSPLRDFPSKYPTPLYWYETKIEDSNIHRERLDELCIERDQSPEEKRRRDSCNMDLEYLETFFKEACAQDWKAKSSINDAGGRVGRGGRRLELPIKINGQILSSRADTGSAKNMMDLNTARNLGLLVDNGPDGIKPFTLGNGKVVHSIGLVQTTVTFLKDARSSTDCVFFILNKCAVPIVMGKRFLDDTQTMTKFKHRLQERIGPFGHCPRVCYFEGSASRLQCFVDGKPVLVNPDTGSEINVMSLGYAREKGYYRRRRGRRERVLLGDGSEAETLGEVTASVTLGDGSGRSKEETFHILPGLPCDILLGEEILDETDAFSAYDQYFVHEETAEEAFEFGILRKLATWEIALRSRMQTSKEEQLSPEEEQLEEDRAERYRRDREAHRIQGLPQYQQPSAWDEERQRQGAYNLARYTGILSRLEVGDNHERSRRTRARGKIAAMIPSQRSAAVACEEADKLEYDRHREEIVTLLQKMPAQAAYPQIPAWP